MSRSRLHPDVEVGAGVGNADQGLILGRRVGAGVDQTGGHLALRPKRFIQAAIHGEWHVHFKGAQLRDRRGRVVVGLHTDQGAAKDQPPHRFDGARFFSGKAGA